MKTLFIVAMIFLSSCVTTHFPSEDIYVRFFMGGQVGTLRMEKGYLDEENKGKTWKPVADLERELGGKSI